MLPHVLADPWSPLEHETIAPERMVGVLLVIVEVSEEFDVRLKWYTTPATPLIAY